MTSLPKLSAQTKLTIQQVRTALKHLISTGEITDEGTSQYRIITIVKYDEYQRDNRQNNSQSTDEQQTNNRRITDEQQQYNNNNKAIMEQCNNDRYQEPLPEEYLPADEARQIQLDHDTVLNAAEDAGFKMSNGVRASLIALYADNGLQKVVDGLRSCVDHGAPNLAYLKAVLKDEPKKTQGIKTVTAQQYTQRYYTGEQEEAFMRMVREIKGEGA